MLRSHSLLMLQATDRPMGMIWLDVASLRPFDLVIPFTIQKGEVTGEVRMASGKVAKLDITDNNDGTVADKYTPTEAGLHEMDIKYDGTHIPGSPLQFYMDCMNGAYGPGLIHDPSGDVLPETHCSAADIPLDIGELDLIMTCPLPPPA
ncbi:filamin-A-like isoform X2 [Oreochromis aureus]|uniref:filamin-A-like isoform X2 n=1 Tax=Oreochromis aureus TaxID=47969 RepID=UPI00195409B0|nr:filamin-A-like isoform X2 [Oreochromis aureus]